MPKVKRPDPSSDKIGWIFFQTYVLVITKHIQCSCRILNSGGSVPLRFGTLHNMGIIDLVNPVLLDKVKWITQGMTYPISKPSQELIIYGDSRIEWEEEKGHRNWNRWRTLAVHSSLSLTCLEIKTPAVASVACAAEFFLQCILGLIQCADKNWRKPMPDPSSGEILRNLVWMKITSLVILGSGIWREIHGSWSSSVTSWSFSSSFHIPTISCASTLQSPIDCWLLVMQTPYVLHD